MALSVARDGGSSIEVRTSGRVNASFTPTPRGAIDLGANALVVDADLTVVLADSLDEPPQGTVNTTEFSPFLYVADGGELTEDEAPITGIHVISGVTLTLAINASDWASVDTSDDIVNDGVVTVGNLGPLERGGIRLVAQRYIGTGDILTFGDAPGMDGGSIAVTVRADGINHGDWLSYGAGDGVDDPGHGGAIEFVSDFSASAGRIENTGDMNSAGGDAPTGATGLGGIGGAIRLQSYLDLWNSGDLDAWGGDGSQASGGGGDVEIAAKYRGELLNTGRITTDGGSANAGEGSFAGRITLEARGGDVVSSGDLHAAGGDSGGFSGMGGPGGFVRVNSSFSDDALEMVAMNLPAGDGWLSGDLISTGGAAPDDGGRGGMGGPVSVMVENDLSAGDQAIHMLGYRRIDNIGGDGGFSGGNGGNISIDADLQLSAGMSSVTIEPPLNSSGGDADPSDMGSVGGDGADILLDAAEIVYGTATADGGAGDTPGMPGTIVPEKMTP